MGELMFYLSCFGDEKGNVYKSKPLVIRYLCYLQPWVIFFHPVLENTQLFFSSNITILLLSFISEAHIKYILDILNSSCTFFLIFYSLCSVCCTMVISLDFFSNSLIFLLHLCLIGVKLIHWFFFSINYIFLFIEVQFVVIVVSDIPENFWEYLIDY